MIVSDIQRFSLHDGPGIRTTVFLKGCNLRCRWCHNPETISSGPQLQFFPERCIGCGACLEACRKGAHAVVDGRRRFERRLCAACGECASGCYAGALVLVGREMTVEQVMAEVLADRDFYLASGGGVTISGGEPLFQSHSTAEVLRACKSEGIHTAIQTNLAWPWQRFRAILPLTDLVMMDIKMMDAPAHERWTGEDNERILANARRLSCEQVPLIVRTPVIAGVNATVEEIARIADFVRGFENLLYYELLAYHPLGSGKYQSLGMEPPGAELAGPDRQTLSRLAAAARQRGIEVRGDEGGP